MLAVQVDKAENHDDNREEISRFVMGGSFDDCLVALYCWNNC